MELFSIIYELAH